MFYGLNPVLILNMGRIPSYRVECPERKHLRTAISLEVLPKRIMQERSRVCFGFLFSFIV